MCSSGLSILHVCISLLFLGGGSANEEVPETSPAAAAAAGGGVVVPTYCDAFCKKPRKPGIGCGAQCKARRNKCRKADGAESAAACKFPLCKDVCRNSQDQEGDDRSVRTNSNKKRCGCLTKKPPPPKQSCSSSLPPSDRLAGRSVRRELYRRLRPKRVYHIYIPTRYSDRRPGKVLLFFHGWTGYGQEFTEGGWARYANIHNYIIVAPDGLGDSPSFTFPGSADGRGKDGGITTCNTGQRKPDYCYSSCGSCPSRCGWTHCLDDDFQFVIDLIADLDRTVCVDKSRVYATGYSNGGMLSWSLGQDSRTAKLLAGLGSIMGLPMHGYNIGKGVERSLPMIGLYGRFDCIVPPGDGSRSFVETCDGEGYYYVDAWKMHSTWAADHGCDSRSNPASYPYTVPGRSEVDCSTKCNPNIGPPASVDCRTSLEHTDPPWALDLTFKFFEEHYCDGHRTETSCERASCTWSRGSCGVST